jgi:YVTN family beta-propeller protein
VVQNISLDNSFAGPWGVAYNPASGTIYVSEINSSSVAIINATTNTLVNTIPTIPFPNDIVYDSSNNEMYVSASDSLYVINARTNQLVTSIGNLEGIDQIAYDSNNGDIYAGTTESPGIIYVVSGNNLVANISVDADPRSVAYDPLNNEIYVTATDSSVVDVINPSNNALINSINGVGGSPWAALFDPTNGIVYVNSYSPSASQLSLINNSVVVKSIMIGPTQYGMAYDPTNLELYLSSGAGTNSVLALNTTSNTQVTNITRVEPSTGPNLAYDPINQDIYVANYNAEMVGVISTGCFVRFVEQGLPSGSTWSLTLGETTRILTSNSTIFVTAAGSTNWSVLSPILVNGGVRFSAFPPSGTLNINSSLKASVNFLKQYEVSFSSNSSTQGTTMPNGTTWDNASSSISISASPYPGYQFSSWSSSNSSIVFSNAAQSSTMATIGGPGNIRANFVANPSTTNTISTVTAASSSVSSVGQSSSTAIASTSFTSSSTTNPSSLLSNPLLVEGVVAIVVVGALSILLFMRRKKGSPVVVGPG